VDEQHRRAVAPHGVVERHPRALDRRHRGHPTRVLYDQGMEGFGGLFGDPDELQRRMAEFAEQMQGQQKLAWADNAIKLAVDLTVAAINRVNIQGTTTEQAEQIRAVMAVVFPEAVTLVREARQGLQ
jgi:CHASE3 domain sensor protein